MSDEEHDLYQNDQEGLGVAEDVEEEEEEMEIDSRPAKNRHRREEEEEEEDDDDDEDDEEDDEEEGLGKKPKKRAKHRHKKSAVSKFLDIEAEVSEEDDEEEDEGELGGDFIENVDDDLDDDVTRRNHARLDSRRVFEEEEDRSPEEIARAIAGRHRDRAVPYTGDMNEIPQRLLMPSVHDASLWQVRVKPLRERDIVFSLMRKAIDFELGGKPLSILSAFQRDSLPGMIYVEARSAKQVQQACNGLVGVYLSRGINLVPIEEMASLLQIKKQEVVLIPGTWVRIRRGKYAGDLAQVMDMADNGEDVGLRLVPRIDMNPKDDASGDPASKKRKKPTTAAGSMRPPQRLFNFEEIVKVYGRKNVSKRNQAFVFQNETYKDGFLEKDFKMNTLSLEDINPTLDEITQFTRRSDGSEDNLVNLSAIAEASKKAAIAVLQPGDHVEVFEGEQAGIHGVVEEVSGDVVTITAQGLDIDGQKMEIPARSVRKRFKPGDHVKVMAGQNQDETGLVVAVADNVVTFISDMTMQEISVFSKDLREAAEVGSGTNIVGSYELHDLVQLDAQTVGVIFKTERDSFRVVDQHGQVRLVKPHQISMRRDSSRAIATDSEGHELRVNDNMKEIDGENRKGRVLHTHQSFYAFLHNRDIVENNGVFVTKARSLASLAPKSNAQKKVGADLSKMNPALVAPTGGMVGSGAMGRGPRDRSIGETVTVIKGPNKGYVGTIRDTNGPIARVELRTGNKVISIDKEKLMRRKPDGTLEKLDSRPGGGGFGPPGSMGPPSSPWSSSPPRSNNGPSWGGGTPVANSGSRTPFGAGGRTPNPYAGLQDGGRTPAWNAGSRTPNPYAADGAKTPAWNASSRTPNPYASGGGGGAGGGGATPAWNVGGGRTPNPYATGANASSGGGSGWGGATPGRNAAPAAGWATPARPTGGWQTPGRQPSSWDTAWSAPTPAAAPTPGLHVGQTPAYGAPTPGPATSQTPGFWNHATSAATPGAAPTPWAGAMDDYDRDLDSEVNKTALEDDWVFNPRLVPYLPRLRIVIEGTQHAQYLNGDYEGRFGRVIAAQMPESSEFEPTARVKFEPSGEERSIVAKYIRPAIVQPNTKEVVVLGDRSLSALVTHAVVREPPERDMPLVISSKANPTDLQTVSQHLVVPLWDE